MRAIKQFLKRNWGHWIYRQKISPARKNEILQWVNRFTDNEPKELSDASFNVFTYHGEDGIIFYLLGKLGDIPKTFVDIGSGDCIKSNCANLAVHFNWNGLFIDQDNDQLSVGEKFYARVKKERQSLTFVASEVNAENVEQLLEENHFHDKIGLLSIDIDGNDYWIWKAIEMIQPELVVIEAKVEFGNRSIAVPYLKENHHSYDKAYNGASIEALRKLGKEKGYTLAGANKQGYNLFFIRQERGWPEESVAKILDTGKASRSEYPELFFTSHVFENI